MRTPTTLFVLSLLVLVPLAALPFDGAAWDIRPKLDLSRAHASFLGEVSYDFLGQAVCNRGDLNGDGYDDIVIGSLQANRPSSARGEAYIFFGRPGGFAMDTPCSKADASFVGEGADNWAGSAVDIAGDLNGDGYDDLVIGARTNSEAHASYSGQIYIVFGKPAGWATGVSLSSASASFWGEAAWDEAGHTVKGVGDVNNDGFDDLLIGAPKNDESGADAGQVYLVLGKASGWAMDVDLSNASASFRGEAAGDMAGFSVSAAGDVNRDGFDDFIIGAPYNDEAHSDAGQVYLVLGKAAGWAMDTSLGASSATFWGEDMSDNAGFSVGGDVDVNGDGYDDLLVGAPEDNDAHFWYSGQSYLILGRPSGWARDTDLSSSSASFLGENSSDYSGSIVTGAGDSNGDGYDDILISSPASGESHSAAGQVYLVLGRATGWAMDRDLSTAEGSFLGERANDWLGFGYYGVWLSGGGDVNGDGFDDFLAGSIYNGEANYSAGQAWLIMPFAAPPAAGNLQASLAPSLKYINLTWDAAAPWNEKITGYRVCRSTDGTFFTDVAFRGPSDRSFSDVNLTWGQTYHYRVITVDGNGDESARPASVSRVCDRDTDGDGIGDLADWDDDGDGVADGADAFPLDKTEWLDTDWDGTGNNADTDDDNDGILDVNDPEPRNPQNALQYHLDFLNTTLRNVQTTVNSVSSTVSTMSTNLNTLSSNVNSMQSSLTGLINDIDSDIATMSAQVRGDIATANSQVRGDIAGLNSTVRADIAAVRAGMDGMNATFQSSLDNVRALVNGVSSDLSSMDAELGAMNRSLSQDMTEMEARLALDIEALGVALEAVNASLQAEIAALDADIAGFRSDMMDELGALKASMDATNRTQTENYKKLENLINGINTTTLADIKAAVAELDAETAQMGVNLNGRIDEFRATAMGRLENISKAMATVDDIKSLSTEVKGVQGQVNGVKKEQEATSKNVAALAPPSWLGVVLIIVVLALAAVLLMRGGKKEAAPASQGPPPGAKPLEPLPPPE
jgi:predicted  nucleic acid-binding Zn-ribbon protein